MLPEVSSIDSTPPDPCRRVFTVLPPFLPANAPLAFPDPRLATPEGIVAIGGDLSVERLRLAYRSGIFPWFDEGGPPIWWSPDPRAVLLPDRLHVSRSLRRRLRRAGFEVTWDRAFAAVMRACGERRPEGTWVTAEMLEAYTALHRAGDAHSVEVWLDGELAGGIYGVHVGGVFAAESKFHRTSDASKVALVHCVEGLAAAGVEVIEVQFLTPHLERLGAIEWPRDRYLTALARLADKPVRLP